MVNDILVILMVAFGLFAIIMFVLLYVFLKKNYNNRHLSDDYTKDLKREKFEEDDDEEQENEEFIPKKKGV